MKRSLLVAVLWLVAWASSAQAAVVDPHSARLAQVARIWGAIKFLDPWIYTHELDWDAALVQALPKLRSAANEDELAAAVSDMLRPLGDSATRVEAKPKEESAPSAVAPAAAAAGPLWSWPAPGVLALDARGSNERLSSQLGAFIKELAKADTVIFDLRVEIVQDGWGLDNTLLPVYAQLLGKPLPTPGARSVEHSGYRPQTGSDVGEYASNLLLGPQTLLQPGPGARRRRAAFICSTRSGTPPTALAMQAVGDAVILATDFDTNELAADTVTLPLGERHVVRYRVGDVVPVGVPPHVDAKLPPGSDGKAAIALALAKLRARPSSRSHAAPSPLPVMTWQPDKAYPEMKSPSVEYRLLALFRLWNVIDRFYPYKDLLDHDWGDVLLEAIPKLEAAEGAIGYRRAIGQVAARIDDGHVWLSGGEDPLMVRPAGPPLLTRVIDGQVVIASVLPVPEAAALRVGDVITAVDGEPVATTIAALRPYKAASNETWRMFTLAMGAVRGGDGTIATLQLRSADGKTREVKVARKLDWGVPMTWRSGDIVKVLDGNIGYVDLDRLAPGDVDGSFEKLAGTRAIIFDMRGYPKGTGWAIAPRLNVKKAHDVARFTRMLVVGEPMESGERLRAAFTQQLGPATGALYRGATFMLIDERTMSQAEHTGLFFEAMAGTRFVGSQTAGANGDVTNLVMPGALRMSFSGHEVRHADGRQLQRVGLHADVEVHPTIQGLQSGRDEVLERALQLARGGK